jgi:hypothetical protein
VPDLTSLTNLTDLNLRNNNIVQAGVPGSGSFNDFILTPDTYLQILNKSTGLQNFLLGTL